MTQTLDRGAPLDVRFINDLVTTVEKLVAASNSSPYKQVSIKNSLFENTSTAQSMRTADARIYAEAKPLVAGTLLTAGTWVPFKVDLTNFASAPVVTATPVVINTTSNNVVLSATVSSVTASAVNGFVYCHTAVDSGQTIGISVTAIGIPSNAGG